MRSLIARLLTLALLALPFISYAQLQGQARLDSLLARIPGLARDTPAVLVIAETAYLIGLNDPEKRNIYARKALALSLELHYAWGMATAYSALAGNYQKMADYPKACEYYLKALEQYEAEREPIPAAGMLINLAILFGQQKEYEKALHYCKKAEQVGMEWNDRRVLQFTYEQMGWLSSDQNNEEEALLYLGKALTIARERQDSASISNQLASIGSAYSDIGEYEKSFDHFEQALKIARLLGLSKRIGYIQGSIGSCYARMAENAERTPSATERHYLAKKAIFHLGLAMESSQQVSATDELMNS